MQNEEWRPIKGYEGLYEISNLGRIKSLPKRQVILHGTERTYYERGEIILSTKRKKRYAIVSLRRGTTKKAFQVHRLVALTFIPNPNNLPYVNHIDENTLNNAADNLEWCTHSYNLRYSHQRRRDGIPKPAPKSPFSK